MRFLVVLAALAVVGVAADGRATTRAGPSPRVAHAIRLASITYGVSERDMRAVAWCESGFDPRAKNPSSTASGLFQFLYPSTWRSTPYARLSVWDPYANALAAAWLVRRDGGWYQWECNPR